MFLSDDFVKLGDFGLSKDMGTSAFTSTYVGVSPHPLVHFKTYTLLVCADASLHATRNIG